MSRFWLTYKSRNHLVGAVILDSSHLMHARLRAAVEGAGQTLRRGHKLDQATAKVEIDDYANTMQLGGMSKFDEVAERPISVIDIVLIGDVIASVPPGEVWNGINQIAVTPAPCS